MRFIDKIMSTSLRNQTIINKAIKPLLEQFNLSYFYCSQITNEGDYSFFGNEMDWGEYYFAQEYFLTVPHYFKPCNFKMGFNLNFLNQDDCFSHIKNDANHQFHLNHVFELGYKDEKGIRLYGFATDVKSKNSVSFYVNEIPLLKLFIKNFHEKHTQIFKDLYKTPVNFASIMGSSFYQPDLKSPKINREYFLKDLGIHLTSKLSKRENDISKYLIKGHSAAEIAFDLNLSKRTIESYIENLKDKLSCFSKKELIQKCLELNSIDYFNY